MTILKENKPYIIEYRIFKDVSWFKGYFRNMKPGWTDWIIWKAFDNLEELKIVYDRLEAKKSYVQYKTEYRMVKKEERTS